MRSDNGLSGRARRHRGIWASIGALLVVAGSTASVLAALAATRNTTARSQKALTSSAAQVASTLRLAIQHENDLLVSAETYVLENPKGSEAQFLAWAQAMAAMKRYPEVMSLGEVEVVPAAQLAAFEARETDRPVAAASSSFVVTPPGRRPFYCLSSFGVSRASYVPAPVGTDFCAGADGAFLLGSADSGSAGLAPLPFGKQLAFSLGVPIYRNGTVPATVAERRAAIVGWLGMVVVPRIVLRTALVGHPGAWAALVFHAGAAPVQFTSGAMPRNSQAVTIKLNSAWSVVVREVVASSGLLNDGGILILIAGVAVSVLLGAVILLLGTGRSRAIEMVAERTDELQFQALHDSLTGLPNRSLILDRLEQLVARGRREQRAAGVMFIDLDDFKDINDTLGHRAGDAILVGVAARLRSALRQVDTIGRLGGDEFVVLIEASADEHGAETVAARIIDVLEEPFVVSESELPLTITASIGVAVDSGQSSDELLRDADIAMYQAKAAGKRCTAVFAPSMQVAVEQRRNLTLDLHGALEGGQFFLLYQPTIDLRTDEFTGVEALLRWRHPERGVIQPNEFIPALEASGLIVPVGAWVLETACRQGAAWRAEGHNVTVSVNVSGRQMERDRIIDDTKSAIDRSGFDPSALTLELTETTLMHDAGQSVERLGLLKALGVRIAVDDFGTGYSSLAYLRQFPIDVLKIDRSFVSGMTNSTEGAALVHTLVQLGKILELETIAEGIEDDVQRLHLRDEQVDIGQGFLFSRPVDAVEVGRLLADKFIHVDRDANHVEEHLPA